MKPTGGTVSVKSTAFSLDILADGAVLTKAWWTWDTDQGRIGCKFERNAVELGDPASIFSFFEVQDDPGFSVHLFNAKRFDSQVPTQVNECESLAQTLLQQHGYTITNS